MPEKNQTIDLLAAINHERSAHYERYVYDQCERRADGSLLMPAEPALRWETQSEMFYTELPA